MPTTITFNDLASKTRDAVSCGFVFADAPFRAKFTRSPTSGIDAIDVALFATDGTTQLTSSNRLYYPTNAADLIYDFSPFASDLMSVDRPTVTEATNIGYFSNDYVNVRIGYKLWDAVSYTVNATVYTLCLGTVQIAEGLTYGQNGAAYLPSLLSTGKWLSMMTAPKVWFYEGAVFSPLLAALVSKSIVDAQTATPDGRLAIRQRFDGGAWQYQFMQATALGVAVATVFDDGAGTAFYTEVSGAKQIDIELWWLSDSVPVVADTQLIPTLSIQVQEACNNPMFLTWKNSKGGFDVWCFEGDRPTETDTETLGTYSVELGDMATQRATTRTFSKQATQSITGTAVGLTLNQVQALTEILYSPSVLLYKNGAWIYVNATGTSSYNERDRAHTFEVNILSFEFLTQNG